MEVWSFLGFTGYYCRFIPKFMQVACPLHELTSGENAGKKKASIKWDSWCQQAFDDLKTVCTTAPILTYANFSKPFKLHTYACCTGLGAVLYQTWEDGTKVVIAYASRSLNKAESHYPAHKLEFLALKWAVVEKFHKYLYGLTFDIYTNNNPLIYVLTTAKLDAASYCWVNSLANYNFRLHNRVGKTNIDADALTRVSLARVHAWQFGYQSESDSHSCEGSIRGCLRKTCLPHRGLQLQLACCGGKSRTASK